MRSTRRILTLAVAGAVLGGVGTAIASSSHELASVTGTGLANAIAHVQANQAAHPNAGLANALTHLQANQAKHAGN